MAENPQPTVRKGLPVRSAFWMAALLGVMVVGSAYLKSRHLSRIAERADWQSADFYLPRATFQIEPSRGDELCPDSQLRSEFMEAMSDYVHGNDADARRELLGVVHHAPDWPRARFYLGVTELHLGHPMMASQNLERALDGGFQLPEHEGEWWLGVAELYCGRRDSGRRLLLEAAQGSKPSAKSARKILEGLDHASMGEGR